MDKDFDEHNPSQQDVHEDGDYAIEPTTEEDRIEIQRSAAQMAAKSLCEKRDRLDSDRDYVPGEETAKMKDKNAAYMNKTLNAGSYQYWRRATQGSERSPSETPGLPDSKLPSLSHGGDEGEILSTILVSLYHRGRQQHVNVLPSSTVADLASACSAASGIDLSKLKLMFSNTRGGMMKAPFPETSLSDILKPNVKVTVLGSTEKQIEWLNDGIAMGQSRLRGRGGQRIARPAKTPDWQKASDEIKYTFHSIHPLPYLPNPERSSRFLERLASDPGIKATMRKHQFSVGLLTEMNPAEHTTQESRTLGLNRNMGEVIELRLRTDRFDGYRDYKVIRKTLCHELSHNVWTDHDRNFWDLTNQIEKEVERGDWKHGGHQLSQDEFYNPADAGMEDHEQFDGGGWTGGEFVLGSVAGPRPDDAGLSRREIIAQATMNRLRKEKDVSGKMDNPGPQEVDEQSKKSK